MTKSKSLKPNKLIVALIVTSLIIIAGTSALFASINLQTAYSTPKVTLTIPTSTIENSAYQIGTNIIVTTNNTTWTITSSRMTNILDPNLQTKTCPSIENQNGLPSYNLNRTPPSAREFGPNLSGKAGSNKIAIIYALPSENNTMLIVRF